MNTIKEQKEYKNIKTQVTRILWYSQSSKWGVLSVENTINDENFNDAHIILTGNFEGLYENCDIIYSGVLSVHQKYGTQIELSSLSIVQDINSKEGIINFLSKSAIKGICIQNAKKIYEKYKDDTINVVLTQTDKLLTIKGIGQKTLEKVTQSVKKYKRMEGLIKYCSDYGIPYSTIYKLDQALGDKALEIIKSNIYETLNYSDTLTFKQIDLLALKTGIKVDDINRAKACLIYTLKNVSSFNSSTGVSVQELERAFKKELGLELTDLFNITLNLLEEENSIIIDNNIVYLKIYYEIEKQIAEIITCIINKPKISKEFKRDIIEEEIKNFPFELNNQQILSIKKCLLSNISTLTSPPGAGKSTIVKALANIYDRHGYTVITLAPTGKASRRLEECTGKKAYTIHKFLSSDTSFVQTNKCVIIIDESSMMDIDMFYNLLLLAGNNTKYILVGDIDQLPSVQIGNVLEDLVKSKIVNSCILTDIVRQKEDSNIIKNCQLINKGYPIDTCDLFDFVYEEFDDDIVLKNTLLTYYNRELQKYDLNDIQVLTPYKIGILGTNNLNKILSDDVNKNETNEVFNFKLGDRVMQIRNNYDKDVFNGETGVVSSITDTLNIDFGGKIVPYEIEDLEELILAYSCSVHKSQGSEYPVVFVILDDSQTGFLLLRKILYTAVSRGKHKVYILSKRYCVDRCINNSYFKPRVTNLRRFLEELNRRK